MANRHNAGRGGALAPNLEPPQGGQQMPNVPQVGRAVERGSLLKPAAFSGKSEEALRWLNTFTRYAKAQHWDDKQSILSIATFMSEETLESGSHAAIFECGDHGAKALPLISEKGIYKLDTEI